MKRFVAIILSLCLLLAGCGTGSVIKAEDETTTGNVKKQETIDHTPTFKNLNDTALPAYLEGEIYSDLISQLNSEDYFVENVSVRYVSQEYLDELEYNSQENIFFGYTLSEIEEVFGDEKFVFSLDENGNTIVKAVESYENVYAKAIKDIAVGTGVILVCITVSTVSVATTPAVSLIFAASAKTGTAIALSSGVFGGVASGFVTATQTDDLGEVLETATLSAAEGFKWGAITGAFEGGAVSTIALKGATLNGLSMNQAAKIQQESKLPLDFIKSFHSVDEYNVYKTANLQLGKVNGNNAFLRKIDWDFVSPNDKFGRTNAERVKAGLSPHDSTGNAYNLHHVGQKADSPLAILTDAEHKTNDGILHIKNKVSEIDRTAFNTEKKKFWNALLESQTT